MSYLGAVKLMNRFIPIFVQSCHELGPLLKKEQAWKWEEDHNICIPNNILKSKTSCRSCPFQEKLFNTNNVRCK